ncbi:hypothetical protein ARMGADRAFT_1171896 [Armillaria gallica]|uniref:Uncharacterized protein n=1 Tax=Armillaria gallica TaxID=47427 RepID=A0A2H3CPR9_ARMGA|nr:hypothetical protein ARMGADRAFT_1171896 [Armillaria gallica]
MSLTNSAPSLRGQCVEHTDYAFCLCSRFFPARDVSRYLDHAIPVLTASHAHYCTCGHGIHAHVDYISTVVHRCPATHCAAYVQDTPQTQECTCAAPLNDHVAIVNPYRVPAALPYRAEFFAGGVRSNVATPPSNAVAASSPNIANLMLSPPPPVPSPSHQLFSSKPTIQGDIPGYYPNTNDGLYVDTANEHLYDHSNVTYNTTPDMSAGPYA